MTKYRFSLDRSSRKFLCPKCGHKTFVRYVDNLDNSYIENPFVGKCDRSINCQYHLSPRKAGIRIENTLGAKLEDSKTILDSYATDFCSTDNENNHPYALDLDITPFLAKHSHSSFYRFMLSLGFPTLELKRVCESYLLGCNRTSGVIFWQTDLSGIIRTGKIMHYDTTTGKRLKHLPPQWVHKKMNLPADWQLRQCLFGLNQLRFNNSKPIALVESEKTAVLMSLFRSEYIWLACGGKYNLRAELINEVPTDSIDIFPDCDAFNNWQDKLPRLQTQTSKHLRIINWLPHEDTHSLSPNADIADLYLAKHFAPNTKTHTQSPFSE